MPDIFVDADACPVKEEVYRVAKRHALKVTLVANSWMRTPLDDGIQLVARCLEKRALALAPTGRVFTEEMIGEALATRDLLSQLRVAGVVTGGPPPFEKRDRSRFLQNLDEAIRQAGRKEKGQEVERL